MRSICSRPIWSTGLAPMIGNAYRAIAPIQLVAVLPSRQRGRFASKVRTAACSKLGTFERRFAASGSPRRCASRRFSKACSRASASVTSEYPPKPDIVALTVDGETLHPAFRSARCNVEEQRFAVTVSARFREPAHHPGSEPSHSIPLSPRCLPHELSHGRRGNGGESSKTDGASCRNINPLFTVFIGVLGNA